MRRFLCFTLLLSLALTIGLVAQQSDGSQIRGTVRDSSAATLPGVTITITSDALPGNTMSTVTDDAGRYGFAKLPPGTYVISFSLRGFSTVERPPFRLLGGFNARVDAVMKKDG